MAQKHSEYDELESIKKDLSSLKSNVVTLTQHLSDDGAIKLADLRGQLKGMAKTVKADAAVRYKGVEKKVKENPGQAVLLAFAGGMLASMLMKRR